MQTKTGRCKKLTPGKKKLQILRGSERDQSGMFSFLFYLIFFLPQILGLEVKRATHAISDGMIWAKNLSEMRAVHLFAVEVCQDGLVSSLSYLNLMNLIDDFRMLIFCHPAPFCFLLVVNDYQIVRNTSLLVKEKQI